MPHLLYIQLEGVDELANDAWRIGMEPEQIREGVAAYGGFFKVKGTMLRRVEHDPKMHVVHATLDVGEHSNLYSIFGRKPGYWPHAHLTNDKVLELRVRGDYGELRAQEGGLGESMERLRQIRRDAVLHKPAPPKRMAPRVAFGLDWLQYAAGNKDTQPSWQDYSRKN